MEKRINEILKQFEGINLDEISKVKLMKRIDSKFIFNVNKLPQILRLIPHNYKALEITGKRIQDYTTSYFDTKELISYFDHHQNKASRFKLRIRSYHNSQETFIELKRKDNKGVTTKERILLNEEIPTTGLSELQEMSNFNIPVDDYSFTNKNNFSRITLVNPEFTERITIDFQLKLSNQKTEVDLPFLCICEIKTDRKISLSGFFGILKQQRIYPEKISKYVLGIVYLEKGVKKNRFKKKLLTLKKIENEHITT